ncbi:DUF7537 family lipoprotein [Halocatena salina]|uniref:Uncharacterized protein n=1 Tax=Halocatena salina TaxID=2934340 RepID=A0A8T9ZYL9_9EURY|nr:hypothetical protein [Halocatena salina]UPM41780.1 hypothetical protein MW046_07205 [Halocatena salina]
MKTRQWSMVCLVVIVGLAGCSGLFPSDGKQSGTTTEPHDLSYPDGYGGSGITDPEKAIDQHESVLSKADSHTLTVNVTGEVSIFNTSMDFQLEQNTAAEREAFSESFSVEESTFIRESRYSSSNNTYEMNKTEDEPVRYETYQESFDSQAVFVQGFISEWLSNATFGEASRVTHDGKQVFRYEVTGVDSAEPFVLDFDGDPRLKSFNGTAFVTENGVVRSFSYTMGYTIADGTNKTLSAKYHITDVDSTTVEEPTWVTTAKEQT